jgi:hypothetical protein
MSNNTDRYAIVQLPDHGPTPDGTVMWGDFPTVMQNIEQSVARQDALTDLEFARIKADQIDIMQKVSRGLQVANFCDSLTTLTRRMDSFEQRRVESIIKARKDREAEEQRIIEDQLSKHPDPDQPHAWDDDGELTIHKPTEPARKEQLAASAHPGPDTPAEDGEPQASQPKHDAGPVPLSYGKLPLSYVKGEDSEGDLPNELLEETPAEPGTDPDISGATEPSARNPIGISW